MPRIIAVAGTHGQDVKDDWARHDSLFFKHLGTLGWEPYIPPFEWDTKVDGLWGKNTIWRVAGQHLFYQVVPPLVPEARLPVKDTYLLAFSHGVNVAIEALAAGLKARGMISVCPPVRSDMRQATLIARHNVERWINLHGDWRDIWAVLGAIGAGHFGFQREIPVAENILVPGGHGAALRNKDLWPGWAEWLEKIR